MTAELNKSEVLPENASLNQSLSVRLPAAAIKYDILAGQGLLDEAGIHIVERLGRRRCIIIADQQVIPLYQERLNESLKKSKHQILATLSVPAGEASKNFVKLQELLEQVLAAGVDRHTLIIALGGGVIGDLAGCVAALALRGLPLVQIPTTLLAQVDSSVGGKNGINSTHGKNTIGAFYQPKLVLIDIHTLATLPLRERRAGYAEVVKYGLIADATFFNWCETRGAALLAGDREAQLYAIGKSCQHKAAIVEADERETGMRALLNLGHTFGHALEASFGYDSARLLHGEAVAIGTVMAYRLGMMLETCTSDDLERVITHFTAVGLPCKPPKADYRLDLLMQLMAQDKKAEAGKLTLIVPHGIGKAAVHKAVDAALVRQVWQKVLA